MSFSPNDVPQVKAYFEPSVGGVSVLDGALVGALSDLSSAANIATQAISANQYTYRATGGPNGLAYLDGDSGTAFMSLATPGKIARVYVVARSKTPLWSRDSAFLGNDQDCYTTSNYLSRTIEGNAALAQTGSLAINGLALSSLQCGPLTPWKIYRIDSFAPNFVSQLYLGQVVYFGPRQMRADIACLIACETLPSNDDDAAITLYLKDKYLPAATAPLAGHIPAIPTSGLLCEVGAHAGIYSDFAGTTPTSNGGVVRRLRDQSGNSIDWFAIGDSTSTLWTPTGLNGTPELQNVNLTCGQPEPFSHFTDGQDHSLAFVFDLPYSTDAEALLFKGSFGDAGIVYTAGQIVRGTQTGDPYPARGLQICVVTYNDTTNVTSFYINGMLRFAQTGTIGGLDTASNWQLGFGTYATNKLFAAWNRTLSAAEIRSMSAALSTLFEHNYRVLLVGNSLMAQSPYHLAYNALGNGVYVHNLGRSGGTWQTLIDEAAETVDREIANSAVPLVIMGGEGCNSSNNGFSLAQIKAKTTEWLNARKAAVAANSQSAVYILSTSTPATYWTSESDRLTYNQWIRDNASAQGYIIADWASDPDMGGTGQNSNTTYYVDGVHYTSAGGIKIQAITTAAILAAVTVLTIPPDVTAPAAPVLSGTYLPTQAILSAVAPSDSDVSLIRFYRAGSQIAEVPATPGQTVTCTDSGRTNDTTYSYTAKALDGAGNLSVASNTVSITPLALSAATVGAIAAAILQNPAYRLHTNPDGSVNRSLTSL